MAADLSDALINLLTDTYGLGPEEFDRATPLFSSRLLDSIVLVELISYVEEREAIKFKASAFRLDNFDTVERIVSVVGRLKGAAPSGA
jgi:acyl carrier protein